MRPEHSQCPRKVERGGPPGRTLKSPNPRGARIPPLPQHMVWEVCVSTLSDPFAIHLRCEACRTSAALHIQEAWRRRQGDLILPPVSVCLRALDAYPICLGRVPYIPFDIGTLMRGSGPS